MNLANILQSQDSLPVHKSKNTTKAQRAIVKFGEYVEVDGYMLPDGEFRVGKVSTSKALGYGKDWVTRKLKESQTLIASSNDSKGSNPNKIVANKPETLVASLLLQLTGEIKQINIDGLVADTISLPDFRILIRYADRQGSPQAQALVDALLDVGLEDWFRLSFGIRQLTLEEKQPKFDKAFINSINWLEDDRNEIKIISENDDRLRNISDYANWSLA